MYFFLVVKALKEYKKINKALNYCKIHLITLK